MKRPSIFKETLKKCIDAHMHMNNFEADFMNHSIVLLLLYKEGKGNGVQRKYAKEILEEAGLL